MAHEINVIFKFKEVQRAYSKKYIALGKASKPHPSEYRQFLKCDSGYTAAVPGCAVASLARFWQSASWFSERTTAGRRGLALAASRASISRALPGRTGNPGSRRGPAGWVSPPPPSTTNPQPAPAPAPVVSRTGCASAGRRPAQRGSLSSCPRADSGSASAALAQ